MVRTFLLLWLVVQLSFRGTAGDYQVKVTVHSLVLLESRCAECYGKVGDPILHDSCCDGGNRTSGSCPASCDVLLRFCSIGDLLELNLTRTLLGTRCVQNPLSSHFEDWVGNDLKAGVTYPAYNEGDLIRDSIFGTPMTYSEAGEWKGAQINISVVDRDAEPGEFEDLIDHITLPINISAGCSVTGNFTGKYNHVQLELTIEVMTMTQDNTDENCTCLPGFTGLLCENVIDSCIGIVCKNGGQCMDGSCNCDPRFTGAMCELDLKVTTNTTSTSALSDNLATSSSAPPVPVVAITVGVVGGVLFSLILVILVLILALLVFKRRRTQSFVIQGSTTSNFDSSRKVVLRSGDVHIYDEAAGNGANKTGTSGSEILKEFNNPIYGDDPELEREYDTTDELHSSSKDHSDQYQELERKFENPIYGDEDDDNLNDPIPAHESNIDYDQVGNVYHTLESEQDRQQRYAAAAGGQAAAAVAASVELKDSSKGKTGKPQHSYEDVQ